MATNPAIPTCAPNRACFCEISEAGSSASTAIARWNGTNKSWLRSPMKPSPISTNTSIPSKPRQTAPCNTTGPARATAPVGELTPWAAPCLLGPRTVRRSRILLAGLDSSDPASSYRATKDARTRAQKLLGGVIDCLTLAVQTGQLPLNGGLRTQLILTTTEGDLRRKDRLGTVFTTDSGPMPLSLFDQSLCDPEITRLEHGNRQEVINAGGTQGGLQTPALAACCAVTITT